MARLAVLLAAALDGWRHATPHGGRRTLRAAKLGGCNEIRRVVRRRRRVADRVEPRAYETGSCARRVEHWRGGVALLALRGRLAGQAHRDDERLRCTRRWLPAGSEGGWQRARAANLTRRGRGERAPQGSSRCVTASGGDRMSGAGCSHGAGTLQVAATASSEELQGLVLLRGGTRGGAGAAARWLGGEVEGTQVPFSPSIAPSLGTTACNLGLPAMRCCAAGGGRAGPGPPRTL